MKTLVAAVVVALCCNLSLGLDVPDPIEYVPFDGVDGDNFGGGVAMSDDTLVVLSRHSLDGVTQGTLYVYDRGDAGWMLRQQLGPVNALSFSGLVAVAGDHIAAVASTDDGPRVVLFHRTDGDWAYLQSLDWYNWQNVWWGQSIAMNGDFLAVGAPNSVFDGRNVGSITMFHFNGQSWNFQAELFPTDTDPIGWYQARVGTQISMSSHFMVSGGASVSRVAVWILSGSVWQRTDYLHLNGVFYLGWETAVTDDGVIAAMSDEDVLGFGEGVVYVWEPTYPGWELSARLHPQNIGYWESFGEKLTFWNGYLLVGKTHDDFWAQNAGSIYVYSKGTRYWDLAAIVDPPSPQPEQHFGNFIATNRWDWVIGMPNSGDVGSALVYGFDDDAPEVIFAEALPAAGAPGTLFTIQATIVDESGVDNVIASVRESGGGTPVDVELVRVNPMTFAGTWDSTGVPPGHFIVDLTAVDSSPSHNEAFFEAVVEFDVIYPDTTPPTIVDTVATPPSGFAGDQFHVQTTVTDDSGVASVTATIRRVGGGVVASIEMDAEGNDQYTANFDSTGVEPGFFTVDITAVDSSPNGNQQTAAAAALFEVLPGLFEDGFESGDTSAWSATVP